MKIEDYFVKNRDTPIEGYVTKKEIFNGVLFLMREPNSDGKIASSFWIKDIIQTSSDDRSKIYGKSATKYYNVFCNILESLQENDIKRIAYMNLYPIKGYGSQSKCYTKTLKKLSESKTITPIKIDLEKPCNCCEIIINRRYILENLNDLKYIVTTKDIYEKLKKLYLTANNEDDGFCLNKSTPSKKVTFKKFTADIGQNKEVTVYSTFHPSARRSINYELV